MKEKIKIKGLRTQLKKLEGEKQALKIKVSNAQREYQHKIKVIEDIQNKIDIFDSKDNLEVSEHALLRYFERVLEYDLEEIKGKILTTEIINFIETLGGNGSYPNNGFRVILKNYTVVSIVELNKSKL